MIRYAKIVLLTLLVFAITGCNLQKKLTKPKKPKVDTSLEVVDQNSIRHIADIKSIALEWKPVKDPRANGYNIYRVNTRELDKKREFIAHVENRFSSHFVDQKLLPSTEYSYAIAVTNKDDQESRMTESIQVATLPTIEPVAFIQALSEQPRQVKILWRPHTSPSVSHYEVEKLIPKSERSSGWKRIARLENRFTVEYIDRDLKDNTTYVYRIKARTFNGAYSKPTLGVKATTKEVPIPPTNIMATKDLPKKIFVKWEKSPTADVSKYRIYRSNFENAKYSLVNEMDKGLTTYTDKFEEDGKKVFYKVTALDVDGLESTLGVTAALGRTLLRPKTPTITLAQIQNGKVILNWKEGDDRARSYAVIKKASRGFFNNKTFKFINITGNRYEDKEIEPNVAYSYSLQAIDEFNIPSKLTPEIELTLPKEVTPEPISEVPAQQQ